MARNGSVSTEIRAEPAASERHARSFAHRDALGRAAAAIVAYRLRDGGHADGLRASMTGLRVNPDGNDEVFIGISTTCRNS